ncbi:GTPase HflX [Opitutales bacterium ASA1]|uniref:GTPase HflX n=1 Tax=Congregicoccus parvus TaxID=3081749 RepID=UPI002B30BF3C|nr:GTPase HflX [Opitutales bacterium ASA1]
MITSEEIQKKVTRALIVGVQMPSMDAREAQALLDELRELVENLQIEVVDSVLVRLRETSPHFLVGTGKTEQLIAHAKELNCDVIVIDEDLSPAQQRNWEAESKLCIIDRREVILDIFADRAHTREAILQVGLARMEYSLPRLKRAWTHLSRQRGGGTSARGQGETQLEADRRIVRDRIAKFKVELASVQQHREVQRRKRMRVPLPTASIVGYTNAGKSTLLNRLTGASVLAEDKLFATLDPTTRQATLPDGQMVLLTDTVGFIRRLPHSLVDAFKATLEETVVADFLIHVIDVSNPDLEEHSRTTLAVLEEIGAVGKRVITVFNKIDQRGDAEHLNAVHMHHPDAVYVSAFTGEGIGTLEQRIMEILHETNRAVELLVPHDRYDVLGRLHNAGGIHHQETRDEGVYLVGRFPPNLTGVIAPFRVVPVAPAGGDA